MEFCLVVRNIWRAGWCGMDKLHGFRNGLHLNQLILSNGLAIKVGREKDKKKICLIVNNTVIKQQVNYLDYWLAEIFSRWIQQGDLKRSRQDWRERDWCTLNTTTTQYKGAVQNTSSLFHAVFICSCTSSLFVAEWAMSDFSGRFCSTSLLFLFTSSNTASDLQQPYGHTAGPCHMTTTQWSEVL